MQTRLIFIRHGEIHNPEGTFYGRSRDIPLSDNGKDAVKMIAKKINESHIDVIITSPLQRAVHTAQIIAEYVGQPKIYTDEKLIDVHIPSLVGKPIALRNELHGRGEDEYSGGFLEKGHESREQIKKRMLDVYHDTIEKFQGKTAVLVSHGDPLRILTYSLLHPDREVPPMGELIRSYYPQKGEGWNMVVDEKGKIIELEGVTHNGQISVLKEKL